MSCQNQPPAAAFPDLPELPRVPETVDPDSWLAGIDELRLTRMVGKDGRISVDKHAYSVGTAYYGQRVRVRVDAPARQPMIEQEGQAIKRVALKELRNSGPIPFADWVEQQRGEASQRGVAGDPAGCPGPGGSRRLSGCCVLCQREDKQAYGSRWGPSVYAVGKPYTCGLRAPARSRRALARAECHICAEPFSSLARLCCGRRAGSACGLPQQARSVSPCFPCCLKLSV